MVELLDFTEDTNPGQIDENLKWHEKPKAAVPAPAKKDRERKPDEPITSLSFDQVNNDADELIELRGEGRYFGVTDPSSGTTINAQQSLGPLCDNCHRRGHVRAKCKTVVCHKCGVVGDHYETQCPSTLICLRCGEKGHVTALCTSKTRRRQYCKTCDLFSHNDDTCPSIWRSYLTIPSTENRLPVASCYNCGDDLHYGDECPQQRTSRVPNTDGSAFSGNNLPRHLRGAYFSQSENSHRNSHGRNGHTNHSFNNHGSSHGHNSHSSNNKSSNNQSYLHSSKDHSSGLKKSKAKKAQPAINFHDYGSKNKKRKLDRSKADYVADKLSKNQLPARPALPEKPRKKKQKSMQQLY